MNLGQEVEFVPGRYMPKLLHDSDAARVVLFGIDAGAEIAPHSSASEVFLLAVEGEGTFVLGDQELAARGGGFVHCPPDVPHGIKAKEPMIVLAFIAPRPE